MYAYMNVQGHTLCIYTLIYNSLAGLHKSHTVPIYLYILSYLNPI